MANNEWDADAYHRISEPQWAFGLKFLETLVVEGDEQAIDAGCGSGRLTAELLKRLPRGHVLAVDRSQAMLDKAAAELEPVFGERVSFQQADLTHLEVQRPADLIFSTATLHWVLDHDALFAALFRALKPGGRLHAQCGGFGNIARIEQHLHALMHDPRFAGSFAKWKEPYLFASPEESAQRLRQAGFTEVKCFLTTAPSVLSSRHGFLEFLEKVVVRNEVEALPEELRGPFLEGLVSLCEADGQGYLLDYVRLNVIARRPV